MNANEFLFCLFTCHIIGVVGAGLAHKAHEQLLRGHAPLRLVADVAQRLRLHRSPLRGRSLQLQFQQHYGLPVRLRVDRGQDAEEGAVRRCAHLRGRGCQAILVSCSLYAVKLYVCVV